MTHTHTTNLKLIRRDLSIAPKSHPTYVTYQHTNPVIFAMRKFLPTNEVNQVVNGYRRSSFTEAALIADYLRGDVPKHPIIKDDHYYAALFKVQELFAPPHKYRPVSFPDLRYYPWTLPTSAEAPYTTTQYWKLYVKEKYEQGLIENERITFHNLYNEIFIHNREKVHRIKDGIYLDRHGNDLKYWNQAHSRSHLVKADEEDKIRMVFGVPKLTLQIEAMFLWPLTNHLVNTDGPMLWGYETLKGGWYAIYNWMATRTHLPLTYLAFDWKQFDKRAQFSVIDDIHRIIENFIDFTNGYMPTKFYPDTTTDEHRLRSLFTWMANAVKSTPDVLPNGDIYQRQHAGIPSGFFQTQILDSMYNTVMILTVLGSLGYSIDKLSIKVQGDDSLIGLVEYIPEMLHQKFKDDFAVEAQTRFGAILNTKKSQMSNSLQGLPLLGFTNDRGLPTRDKHELLASLLKPERKTDPSKLMARCVGIAFANCGHHPQVYEICKDVFNYLQSKGYSPNPAGLPDLIRIMEIWEHIPFIHNLDRFPSFQETMSRLTSMPTRTPNQKERFWPTSIFLSEY